MSQHFQKPTADTPLFRRADILLTVFLIVIGLVMSFFLTFGDAGSGEGAKGARLEVSVDGEHYETYSMARDQRITIRQAGHSNTFEIKDGQVHMIRSDCPGQDCIGEGFISGTGETIVCLPNRVVLEVTGGEEEFDVIAQ